MLVTSRNNIVPRDARHVHNMKTLDDNKSWEFFLNKAFAYDTKGNCPPELEGIGRRVVGKCGGLPLAITLVGGLLQEQRQSWKGWERVLIGIDSHLGRSDSRVSAILELSYHNLPPHLKSCFLCLAFSKEDAAVHSEKLLHVWIAEGLISQQEGDVQDMVEEKARDYLEDLINRNMVQVKDMTEDGRVKNCQIHDLLRELCLRKAKEEISFEILRNQGSNSRSLDQKSRHRAIYCTNLETFISSVGSTTANNKHTCSLFFHRVGNYDDDTTNDIDSPSYWKSFKLLRVLDFQRFHLTVLPEAIGSLSGLKYLGLRHNFIKKLPSSLGSLKNLEVLDIVGNNGVEVPNVIWKMDSLRHFYMFCIRCEVPLRIDTLKNLRTLIYIPLMGNNWSPEQLIQMTNLRILGICINTDRDVGELITSLAVLDNLECLKLWWYDIPKPSLDRLVSLHRVTQLKLWGPQARVPSAGNFPPNLSHLTLHMAGLRADPMPVLEKLTNLVYLRLSVNAYSGKEMSISHDGFPRLKVLLLYWLDNLTNIQFAGMGGMPEIKRFEMRKCPMLKSLPDELRLICKELKKAYL